MKVIQVDERFAVVTLNWETPGQWRTVNDEQVNRLVSEALGFRVRGSLKGVLHSMFHLKQYLCVACDCWHDYHPIEHRGSCALAVLKTFIACNGEPQVIGCGNQQATWTLSTAGGGGGGSGRLKKEGPHG